MTSTRPSPKPRSGWRAAVGSAQGPALAKALLCVLAVYLLWPAVGTVHPEGFTAQVQIAAIAEQAGLLDRANLSYPLHAEYFYLSRQGVVALLDLAMRLAGSTSDGVFQGLVLTSFLVLIATSLIVVRQRSTVGAWPAAAALLLTPGVAELPFYFSDNVVSAAFAVSALALLTRQPGSVRPFLAGVAFGIGAVCRPDAFLLAPVVVGFCWLDETDPARRLRRIAIVLAGVATALVAAQAWTGASLWQSLQIGQEFDRFTLGQRTRPLLAQVVLVEFGLPQLLLLPVGIVLQWRAQHRRYARGVLVALPLLLAAFIVPRASETRQFYPLLTPFIALYGGRALAWLLGTSDGPQASRRTRLGVGVLIAVVWLLPPGVVYFKDGPRTPLGRLWSPAIWRQWQSEVRANRDDVERLVDRADRGDTAVLTTHFNTDHYLRLTLWQRGWRPFTAEETFPPCHGGFEAWRRPGSERTFVHVRTENPHFIERPADYVEAIQVRQALRCRSVFERMPLAASGLFDLPLSVFLGRRIPALASRLSVFGWHPEIAAAAAQGHYGLRRLFLTSVRLEDNRTAELGPDGLAALTEHVERLVATTPATDSEPLPDYDGVMRRFGPRVAWVHYVDSRAVWTRPEAPAGRAPDRRDQ